MIMKHLWDLLSNLTVMFHHVSSTKLWLGWLGAAVHGRPSEIPPTLLTDATDESVSTRGKRSPGVNGTGDLPGFPWENPGKLPKKVAAGDVCCQKNHGGSGLSTMLLEVEMSFSFFQDYITILLGSLLG